MTGRLASFAWRTRFCRSLCFNNITILKSDIPTVNKREFFEDKFICKLGTLSPNGLNADTHQYAKDMYSSYRNLLYWRQKNLYIELYSNVQSNLSKKLNSWLCHTKWRNVELISYYLFRGFTFAKMDKKRQNAKVTHRESFSP